MDAADYKAKKDAAHALRRSTLEEILRVVQTQDSALSATVETHLRVIAIEAPEKHIGEPEWVQISLPEELAEFVLDCLGSAEAGAVALNGEANWGASRMADLVDMWQSWCQRAET